MPPPATRQAALIEAIFQRPALFYYLRRPIYWGTFRRLHDALALTNGERLLDVGCGPGFYVAELLEDVGPEGSVVGVDSSPAMLADRKSVV